MLYFSSCAKKGQQLGSTSKFDARLGFRIPVGGQSVIASFTSPCGSIWALQELRRLRFSVCVPAWCGNLRCVYPLHHGERQALSSSMQVAFRKDSPDNLKRRTSQGQSRLLESSSSFLPSPLQPSLLVPDSAAQKAQSAFKVLWAPWGRLQCPHFPVFFKYGHKGLTLCLMAVCGCLIADLQ